MDALGTQLDCETIAAWQGMLLVDRMTREKEGGKWKENGNYYIVYWGGIGINEKKMETTMLYYGSGVISGLYRGHI